MAPEVYLKALSMARNVAHARAVVRDLPAELAVPRACACKDALKYAILTERARIPAEARDRMAQEPQRARELRELLAELRARGRSRP